MKQRSDETVRFFSPAGMKYVQAVYGAGVTNEFPRHVHRAFCVGVVRQGSRVISQGGRETVIPKNGLFIINPDTAHACKSQNKQGQSYLALCIDREHMRTIASTISGKARPFPHFTNTLAADPGLACKIRRFFSLLEHPCPLPTRESALHSFLSALILRHGDAPPIPCQAGPQREAVNRICEFIETHYADTLSLEQLARKARLSPFHFQRVFLKNTGVSPHDYLVQLRIKKAQALLLKRHGIVRVSLDTGFADQSHFTHTFKKVIGITPGKYLQLHKTWSEVNLNPRHKAFAED